MQSQASVIWLSLDKLNEYAHIAAMWPPDIDSLSPPKPVNRWTGDPFVKRLESEMNTWHQVQGCNMKGGTISKAEHQAFI